VGHGLSVDAGLPSWYELAAELAGRIDYGIPNEKLANGQHIREVVQAYLSQKSPYELVKYLRNRLDVTGRKPTVTHRALARLPIYRVFSWCYDGLLEDACRELEKCVIPIQQDSDSSSTTKQSGHVNIVKLCGDLGECATALAQHNHDTALAHKPMLVRFFESEVSRCTVLYLGWSTGDPFFEFVFKQRLTAQVQAGHDMVRPAYTVMFDITEAQKRDLERHHIRLVTLPDDDGDRPSHVAAWLDSLAYDADGPSVTFDFMP
jgi:hypothetical protein